MRYLQLIMSVAIMACLTSATAEAARVRPNATAKAVSQSREALFRHCGAEVFRKFGWHDGGRRVLYVDFLYEQQELCVRNGGKL
jgi:hypothetical protein